MEGVVEVEAGPRRRPWLLPAELGAVAGLFAADLHGYVPLSKVPFLLLVGWASLRLRGLRWRSVGLTRPASWSRALVLGLVAGLVIEVFQRDITRPLLTAWLGADPDYSELRPLVGNLGPLALALALNWVLAALGEELVWRGYLLNRVAGLAGGRTGAWALSLLVVNAAFGWGHFYQGPTGFALEGLAGLWLGLLYLACGRSLVVPIVAHGVSNTLALVLIYLDRYPGV